MRVLLAALLMVALPASVGVAHAQNVGEIFRKVNSSVVVIRAKGRDVTASAGLTRFNETGSGVLISTDGTNFSQLHEVPAGIDTYSATGGKSHQPLYSYASSDR